MNLIPMNSENLQLFAEEPAQPVPAEGGDQQGQKPEDQKTFTQEDVNNVVARESKTAVEKLLKEVGIAPEGDYKASLKAFKDWQDSQKTELTKASENLTAAEAARAAAESKAEELTQQVLVMSKGIPAEKSAQYVKLASAYIKDGVDFAGALDLALKDFPISNSTPGGVPGASGNPANPLTGKTDEQTYLDGKYANNPYYKK